jgi:hypothetical protein
VRRKQPHGDGWDRTGNAAAAVTNGTACHGWIKRSPVLSTTSTQSIQYTALLKTNQEDSMIIQCQCNITTNTTNTNTTTFHLYCKYDYGRF